MLMRRVSSKDKIPNGLLRTAVASGAAVALATASLGVIGPANASCFNFSGIAIGGPGCAASFGSIAIVIGPTTDSGGTSFAIAGNPDEFSPFNFALSVGGTADQPSATAAGFRNAGGLPAIGNLAFATAGSNTTSSGLFNLAASFGGTRSILESTGVGNSTLNLGSDNNLAARGAFNNATVLFGDENSLVRSQNDPGGGLIPTAGLNVAFSVFGNNNAAVAGPGPGAIAGLIGVNDQNGDDAVTNSDFGIELRTPFNVETPTPPASTSLTTGNLFRPTTFAAGSFNKALSGSLTNASTQFSSSLNKISSSLSKTISDTVNTVTKNLTGGLTARPKASDSTNE